MILILSSQVSASPVGGGAQAVALTRMGFETALAPTVLFGRHPGLGPPGGGPVPQPLFEGVLSGIRASEAFGSIRGVITGYFATSAQVATAVAMIAATRAANPAVLVAVDPIMGDAPGGLYIPEDVAEALARELLPRADLISPNAWELARLAGTPVVGAQSAVVAARSLGRTALVSSICAGDRIGAVFASRDEAWVATHARQATDPKGAGDLLTALFVGHTLSGAPPKTALRASVREVAGLVAGLPTSVSVARV